VIGNLSKIIEILPEHYTMTDFDVHIEDSTKSYQNMQALSAMGGELVKAGAADLEDVTNIVTASGLTELKRSIERSIAKKKAENDMIGQLQQQVQQYEQSIKEAQNQNQELQNKIQQLQSQVEKNNQQKLELEAERLAIEKERVRIDKDFKDKTIAVKQQQVEAQVAEMFDSNPYNDKIKSNI
jgi:chromosome segregation ATPase